MATTYKKLQGIAYWAKLQSPDTKFEPHKYKICLYLNDDNMAAFKASGMGLHPKTDDKGTFITLSRPLSKEFAGKTEVFGPPEVIAPDGTAFEGLIGNGSHVECTVVVYDTSKGKGHRLQRVKILDLVEYIPVTDAIPFAS